MWSNGTGDRAGRDVLAEEHGAGRADDYGAYTGFPKNVTDIKVVGPTTITMTMDQSYSPTWFLYNELSQVTPMPKRPGTGPASGPSSCTTKVGGFAPRCTTT